MIYQLDKIMQDVRICLDQNMTSDALIESVDIDTLSLDDIIRSKILEAVQRVHMEAPHYMLESTSFGGAVHISKMGDGWMQLPESFMRLVVFQMDDWERPVYHAISTDDPEYAKQRSRFKGIRGTAQRPVCAIAIRPDGDKVLEFYSCKSEDATVLNARCMSYPVIDATNHVDISKRCYQAVVYTVAGLTLISCGAAENSQILLESAKTLLV